MNNNLLQIKIEQRLNKLSSQDFQNIECWMKAEAFNKAMDAYVGRQIEGINQTRTTAEGSLRTIDKLQVLLTTWSATWSAGDIMWTSPALPDNYLDWCRLSGSIQDECKTCPPRTLVVYIGTEADRDIDLRDRNRQPSYDWAESFATISDGSIKLYTNGLFNVVNPVLTYYRKPRHIQIANCTDPDTGLPVTVDVECELPDGVTEIIIDQAAAILSGDMSDWNKQQVLTQVSEHDN